MSNFKTYASLIMAFLIIGGIAIFGYQINHNLNGIPQDSPEGSYEFVVQNGDVLSDFGQQFEDDSVVVSSGGFSWQLRLNPTKPLQTGTYQLDLPASSMQILDQIDAQTSLIESEIAEAAKRQSTNVTLREGITMDTVIDILDEKGVVDAGVMASYLQDPANFDRDTYPFLPEPLDCTYGDVTTCGKYYGEGYFYPDTYNFFTPSEPSEVAAKILNNFDRKVWSKIDGDIDPEVFHRAVIMGSVIQVETGRPEGITASNKDAVSQERREVAAIFYNRITQGIKWQSDVTGVYGTNSKLCQQTFEIQGCLYLDDPIVADNLHNTYAVPSYPIGPINSPDVDCIQAALNPTVSENIYFVSDISGQLYYAKTSADHTANIQIATARNAELQG